MKIYNEYKAEEFLKKYLNVTQRILTKDVSVGLKFCSQYKYPIALKIISDQALHKTDIKGVRVVNSDEGAKKEFDNLIKLSKKLKLKLDGILFQDRVLQQKGQFYRFTGKDKTGRDNFEEINLP